SRRSRRNTWAIVSMSPIVQHRGQPFRQKRATGSRATPSQEPPFRARRNPYRAAIPTTPLARGTAIDELPNVKLAGVTPRLSGRPHAGPARFRVLLLSPIITYIFVVGPPDGRPIPASARAQPMSVNRLKTARRSRQD